MASGKTHYAISTATFAVVASVSALIVLESKTPGVQVTTGGLVAGSLVGLFVTPDSDLKHNYAKRRLINKVGFIGWLAWLYFLPFAAGAHRGVSHTLLGTFLRWLWLWWPSLIIFALLAIAPEFVILFLLGTFLGQFLQDTTHLIMDKEFLRLW